ncbi:hypothetical protein PspLS_09897 [Pyricularia sp. CBS 133598]|nr:hypothetical protein PspLS_09897 [Pyricularia sp. CBS 133598]
MVVCANGFVDPVLNPGKAFKHFFEHTPVNFLKIPPPLRVIEKTHMGKILNAVILRPEDF